MLRTPQQQSPTSLRVMTTSPADTTQSGSGKDKDKDNDDNKNEDYLLQTEDFSSAVQNDDNNNDNYDNNNDDGNQHHFRQQQQPRHVEHHIAIEQLGANQEWNNVYDLEDYDMDLF